MRIEDYQDKVERIPEVGCHLWTGSLSGRGYGSIKKRGRYFLAHRVAWASRHGEIPEGMFICHRCDQPSCVNPEHLFLATHAENMADMVRKGRSPVRRGEANHGVKLTDEAVKSILLDVRVHREIAAEYRVSRRLIGRIKAREKWGHVSLE